MVGDRDALSALLTAISALGCTFGRVASPAVNATLVKISGPRDKPKRRAALCLEGIAFNYFDRHSKIVGGKTEMIFHILLRRFKGRQREVAAL